MESVRSAFHAQLATVMDSLLAAAVCEIAKIFESSLCDQQLELAQKTEEISVLRCRLEKQDRRLKAEGAGSEGGEESPGGNMRLQPGSGILTAHGGRYSHTKIYCNANVGVVKFDN